MKQRGVLPAKGRVMGVQFSTLLTEGLFFCLACYSNSATAKIFSSLVKMGLKPGLRQNPTKYSPFSRQYSFRNCRRNLDSLSGSIVKNTSKY